MRQQEADAGMQYSEDVLSGTVPDNIDRDRVDPVARFAPLSAWLDRRYEAGLDPYSKYTNGVISTTIDAHLRKGHQIKGINFASQEYLNLATHPTVTDAAKEAIDRYGLHSAGSAALMGNTRSSVELEETIQRFTSFADCTLFPTGWSAGYGIIRTLVRETDHVVIDVLAHACLHEGARAATRNVHPFPHLSSEGVRRRLKRIRESDSRNAIVVVTESTFSMDSDVPNLRALQEICSEYGAILVVDCAHDLGAIGPGGRGYLEIQDMVGKVDILMGSFSKTFASNGGFVATDRTELKLGIRYTCGPHTFSNALSPISATVIRTCFDIVASDEGRRLRNHLMDNIVHLRGKLSDNGFTVLGRESAIVPVILGDNGLSRLITRYTLENGGIVNLVEYPAVSKNTCRWRLQVMADHTREQIDRFVEIAAAARERALGELGMQTPGSVADAGAYPAKACA